MSFDGLRMNGGSPSPQPSPIKGEGIDVSFDGLRMNGGGWGFTLSLTSPIKGEGIDVSFDGLRMNGGDGLRTNGGG